MDQFYKPIDESIGSSLLPIASRMNDPMRDYQVILLYYSERILTNQDDALLAMAGMIRRFSIKMKSRFFQGIPAAAFDMFIPFGSFNSLLRRRRSFPSYSWAGWIGKLEFVPRSIAAPNDWLSKRTWIVWFKRSPSGILNLVWDIMANDSFRDAMDEDVGYRQQSPFGSRHSLGFSTSRTAPSEHHFQRPVPRYPILQFWTLAVYYTIADFEIFTAVAYILDNHQRRCGVLTMDSFEEDTFFKSGVQYEFILLSEGMEEFGGSVPLRLGNNDYPTPSHPDAWKYYHVLVLEWKEGIAERRGFGIIFQTAVEKSSPPGPVWKEILMA